MADKSYKILAINPGATSTKVALFEGEECVFSKNVSHEASRLAEFAEITDQIPYRLDIIRTAIAEAGVSLDGLDACVGRGGVPRRQVRGLQLRRVPPGRRRLGVRPSPRQDGRRLRHRRRRGPHGPDPLRRGARLRDRGLAG